MSKVMIITGDPTLEHRYRFHLNAEVVSDEIAKSLWGGDRGLFEAGEFGVAADATLVAMHARDRGCNIVVFDAPEANREIAQRAFTDAAGDSVRCIQAHRTSPQLIAEQPLLAALVHDTLVRESLEDFSLSISGAARLVKARTVLADVGLANSDRNMFAIHDQMALAYDHSYYGCSFMPEAFIAIAEERFRNLGCPIAGATLAENEFKFGKGGGLGGLERARDLANQVLRLDSKNVPTCWQNNKPPFPSTAYLIAAELSQDSLDQASLYIESGDPVGLVRASKAQLRQLGELASDATAEKAWAFDAKKEQLVDSISSNIQKAVKGLGHSLAGGGFNGVPSKGGVRLSIETSAGIADFAEHPIYSPQEVWGAAKDAILIAKEHGLVRDEVLAQLSEAIAVYESNYPYVEFGEALNQSQRTVLGLR